VLRKIRSLIVRIIIYLRSVFFKYFTQIFQNGISIDKRFSVSKMVEIFSTDSGVVRIGKNVSIGFGTKIICQNGLLTVGDNVFIGPGCIIVCRNSINIGADTQISEYCTIRDQDHSYECRPIRSAGYKSAPVNIGNDCWIGAKSSILKGASVGNGAVIGAHSLVLGSIHEYSLAVGSPARVVKLLPKE
jgi:acetyltransferase-like isoleucine patch superfamily enzyme